LYTTECPKQGLYAVWQFTSWELAWQTEGTTAVPLHCQSSKQNTVPKVMCQTKSKELKVNVAVRWMCAVACQATLNKKGRREGPHTTDTDSHSSTGW